MRGSNLCTNSMIAKMLSILLLLSFVDNKRNCSKK